MAENRKFRRPSRIDFEPREQEEVRSDFRAPEPDTESVQEQPTITKAENVIIQYSRTIEYMNWLESLMDDRLKDVSVTVNPDDQPEVWLAMQRVFSNPDTKLDYRSYKQVLGALEEMNELESEAAMPEMSLLDEFIDNLPEAGPVDDSAAEDLTIPTEDTLALEEALRQQTFSTKGEIGRIRAEEAARLEATVDQLEKRRRWFASRLARARRTEQTIAAALAKARGADDRNRGQAFIAGLGFVAVAGLSFRITQLKRRLDRVSARLDETKETLRATIAGERDDELLKR